jgi:hypothetical protein
MSSMSWIVRRALKLGLIFSAAIGIAAFAFSGLRAALLEAYLLGIGGVSLLAFVRTTGEQGPATSASDFDRAVADMSRRYPSDSGELSLVHDVQQSVASTFHLHTRLRPILREIAAHRLSMRFGVDLDRDQERARELIGADAWELVRPGRPPPGDRLAAGPPASHLSKVVEELERI